MINTLHKKVAKKIVKGGETVENNAVKLQEGQSQRMKRNFPGIENGSKI